MTLTASHRRLFQIETGIAAVMIASSLKKLIKNPSDEKEIEMLLNNVDVVMGDAKFLGDKELEENTKMITILFKKPKDERSVSEIELMLNRFTELVWG